MPLRYGDFALDSYKLFVEMRNEGRFLEDARFQVSLPSPTTVINSLVEAPYRAQLDSLYETRMMQILQQIQAKIPTMDLTI